MCGMGVACWEEALALPASSSLSAPGHKECTIRACSRRQLRGQQVQPLPRPCRALLTPLRLLGCRSFTC